MLKSLYVIDSHSVDPRHNIALEEYLLRHVKPGECIFYLWQNQRTVVIGRNQHASNECRIQALEADGGHLVRRLSGGGAVYHDLGNLNFTFLTHRKDYDVEKQTEVILRAVQALGMRGEKNGRNDLTLDGGKFSGHAYYRAGDQCYHHGTLMVEVDLAPLERYLNVSPLKLQAKGVQSVRSRVVNLRDYRPDLTIPMLKQALTEAFSQVYGLPVTQLRREEVDQEMLHSCHARFADPVWTYGEEMPLEHSREARFDWGTLRLDYTCRDGVIQELALWSDGLEGDYLSQVPALLRGCPCEPGAIRTRLGAEPGNTEEMTQGILSLLMEE